MGFKVGIPCMKCSVHPSQQVNKKTGKSSKTCGISSAWREMNDEREGRDITIDKSLTKNNVWMDGSTDDDVLEIVQAVIDEINSIRKENGLRAMRKDTVSVVEIIEKPPIEYMNTLSYGEKVKFLSDSHEVMKKLISDWNPNWKVFESVQHHDEFGGLSGHNHSLVMVTSVDKDGLPTMRAKSEFNLKFFSHINRGYAAAMREKGYDVEDCQTYDRLSEEEKLERKKNPKKFGVDAYTYKMQKLEEQEVTIKQLEAKENYISEAIDNKKIELTDMEKKINDYKNEEQIFKIEKANLAKEKNSANEAKRKYEDKFLELTNAPDIFSYDVLEKENESLKKELTLKDSLIERLKKEHEQLKSQFEQLTRQVTFWKERFADISKKAGIKLMSVFGYDVSGQPNVADYPLASVTKGLKEYVNKYSDVNPKQYRVIPDSNNQGSYRLVLKNSDGSTTTIKDNFDSRDEANAYRTNLVNNTKELSDEMKLERKHGLK